MRSQLRNTFLLTPLVCVAFFVCSATTFAQSAEEIHAQGQQAYGEADLSGAMQYFRQAAELGYAPSQAMLGRLLDAAEFNDEALQWYHRSADQGDAQGQYGLAAMLLNGEAGEQDFAAATRWFTTAADNGSVDAMRVLEHHYRTGGMGLEADPERADYWLQRAVKADNHKSQEQLEVQQAAADNN